MRIAVATENGESISADVEHSPYFVVLEVEAGRILDRSVRGNSLAGYFRGPRAHWPGSNHQSDAGSPDACLAVEDTLRDCDVIISHRLGRGICKGLRARGIDLIATEETQVEQAVLMYLNGTLSDRLDRRHASRRSIPNRTPGG
jgi:predicted Fe-Mo cluster-binding NifX family protein